VTGATDLAAGDPPALRRDPGPTPWAAAARRRRLRVLAVTAVLVVATGAGYLLLLGTGPVRLSPGEVLAVLTGGGDARAIGVVWDLRLPVAVATVAVGAALGLAGAWTQTLARNPIASPDLLGVSGGAAVAVVAGTVVARPGFAVEISPYWWRALLAVAGAAAVVAVLALLGGFSAPRRLVVIGVALGLMCQGLLGYLMVRADLSRAAEAQTWLAGSTGLVRADSLAPMLTGLAVCALLGASVSRDLPVLTHDDATAATLGVHVGRVRLVLLVAATGLVGVSVAVVGPIGFVALVAPQLVRVAAGSPAPPPAASAAGGAALLTWCAVGAAVLPVSVPVGLATAIVGGPVLVVLVLSAARRRGAR